MPLSEHEQRLLEQMERALYAEDPKFASALRGADLRAHYRRRILLAAAGFLVGIALLVSGVVYHFSLSVVGFAVMLTTAFLALTSWRAIPGSRDGAAPPDAAGRARRGPAGRSRKQRGNGRMMDRLEERWNRRREENGR